MLLGYKIYTFWYVEANFHYHLKGTKKKRKEKGKYKKEN